MSLVVTAPTKTSSIMDVGIASNNGSSNMPEEQRSSNSKSSSSNMLPSPISVDDLDAHIAPTVFEAYEKVAAAAAATSAVDDPYHAMMSDLPPTSTSTSSNCIHNSNNNHNSDMTTLSSLAETNTVNNLHFMFDGDLLPADDLNGTYL